MVERNPRALLLAAQDEESFQANVLAYARAGGWLAYHAHDSRRSAPGFPDLVLAHEVRATLVFAELKTERGKVEPAQADWLRALAGVRWNRLMAGLVDGPHSAAAALLARAVPVCVWRPTDTDTVRAFLAPNAGAAPGPVPGLLDVSAPLGVTP